MISKPRRQVEQHVRPISGGTAGDGKEHYDQRLQCLRKRSWFVLAARHSPMGDGSYLYFVWHTEIHPAVRRRHCFIHFQQSFCFMAVYLRDQRRGLSARHHRVDDSRSSRRRCIYPDSIGTRRFDGNWDVCDYVVVFLLHTGRRQMEPIHRPNSMEPHRGIPVQRCRPSLCLYRAAFGITAKESRTASVQLKSRTRRIDGKCRKPTLMVAVDAPRQRAAAQCLLRVDAVEKGLRLATNSDSAFPTR